MKFTSITEAIRYYSVKQPDKLCIVDSGGEITYGRYYRRICGVASLLLEKGIKPGDCVIAKAAQTIDYLVLCHSVQIIGALFVPLEKNVAEGRINEIITKTDAVLFVGDVATDACSCMSYTELAGMEAESEPCSLPYASQDSMILFTTGTTGKSKGILLTHSSEVAVAENVKYGVEMKKDNIEILPMPVNHSYGLRRYFANIINGSTVILLDGVVFIQRFYKMLDQYHATAIAMAPAALAIIFKLSQDRIGRYNGRLDYIQFGSAPLPEPDKERLLRLLPDCRLYNLYGTTEAGCSSILNFNSPDNRPHSIGRPTCNSHFDIVDEDGNIIRSSKEKTGFLICSGGMSMKGYYKDPKLTAATKKNGSVYTNDIGYIDEDGLIYMLGRADDVINTGGNKIAPGEIEEIVRRFPGVADCACVAMKDPLLGQVPKLFIVAGGDFDTAQLYGFLSDKLEGFKLPKAIENISEIPRTYNGKIWRSKLTQ